MKILFICTCLEPGRDGVGDYTRRLAEELAEGGVTCHLLALRDRFVFSATRTEEARVGGGVLDVLRLPENVALSAGLPYARRFCEEAAPDWISLQIVLYGFDPRGLCFSLARHLAHICEGHRTQIMFHELWVGEAAQATWKHKVLGGMQRQIVRDLWHKVRPEVVHTHTPLYQHLLSLLGCRAIRLPLFGNVPLGEDVTESWVYEHWNVEPEERGDWWLFVTFGSIHPEWDGQSFFEQTWRATRAAGKGMGMMAVGRLGDAGEVWWRRLENRDPASCRLVLMGEQPVEEISRCLRAADFGVSAVPPEYLFKSGTAVAMLEHGLPVITTRKVSRYRHCPAEIVAEKLPNNFEGLRFGEMARTEPRSFLPAVARQFRADLEGAAV